MYNIVIYKVRDEEKMKKLYKEANKCETETTINMLYSEQIIEIYTNKVSLQKQLNKLIGKPKEEYIKGRSITGSIWQIPFSDKSKITKMILKANIFEL